MNKPRLGNFFSGSGTWELAAEICGMEVAFESEIEPFPIAVEAKRFPNAIQLGDIKNVNGADLPCVDILCNSSPCQDLSVAGGRKGMKHEDAGDEETTRSGLFYEVIRITKEMRDAYNERLRSGRAAESDRPVRFWCWENVPGAFSSNRGADFKAVLDSLVEIVQEESSDIPIPEGGWHYAGVLDGDGWQIAWRTMDAQYFGVAQRRRRVFLVMDLDGHSAGEILFERESVSWNFKEIAEAWEDASRSLGDRIGDASRIVMGRVRGEESGVAIREVEKN